MSIAYAMHNASRRVCAGSFAPLPLASFLDQSRPDNSDRYLSTHSCIAVVVTRILSMTISLLSPSGLWQQKGRRTRAFLPTQYPSPNPFLTKRRCWNWEPLRQFIGLTTENKCENPVTQLRSLNDFNPSLHVAGRSPYL